MFGYIRLTPVCENESETVDSGIRVNRNVAYNVASPSGNFLPYTGWQGKIVGFKMQGGHISIHVKCHRGLKEFRMPTFWESLRRKKPEVEIQIQNAEFWLDEDDFEECTNEVYKRNCGE